MEDTLEKLRNAKIGDIFYHVDTKKIRDYTNVYDFKVVKVGRDIVYFSGGFQIRKHSGFNQLDHPKKVNYTINSDDRVFATKEAADAFLAEQRERITNFEEANTLSHKAYRLFLSRSDWSIPKLKRVVGAMEAE